MERQTRVSPDWLEHPYLLVSDPGYCRGRELLYKYRSVPIAASHQLVGRIMKSQKFQTCMGMSGYGMSALKFGMEGRKEGRKDK